MNKWQEHFLVPYKYILLNLPNPPPSSFPWAQAYKYKLSDFISELENFRRMFQEKKLISSYRRSKRQQWVERGSERTTVCPTWHLRVMEETLKKCNQVLTKKYTLKLQYVRLIKKQCLCLRVSHKSSLLVNNYVVNNSTSSCLVVLKFLSIS